MLEEGDRVILTNALLKAQEAFQDVAEEWSIAGHNKRKAAKSGTPS